MLLKPTTNQPLFCLQSNHPGQTQSYTQTYGPFLTFNPNPIHCMFMKIFKFELAKQQQQNMQEDSEMMKFYLVGEIFSSSFN